MNSFFHPILKEFSFVLPEIFLLSSILLLIIVVSLQKSKEKNTSNLNCTLILNTQISKNIVNKPYNIVIIILFLTLLLTFFSFYITDSSNLFFNNMLVTDKLTFFVKTLVLLSSITVLIISYSYLRLESFAKNNNEYYILILLVILGILLLISSYDFLSFYLALEFQSLSLYVLASYRRDSEYSTEAGLKYFVLGAFSSGLLLFGISILYGILGTTNFNDLQQLFVLPNENLLNLNELYTALLLILSGLFFKISIAPFHMWTPDVYEGAPLPVTAFFAIVPKIAIFSILIRLKYQIFLTLTPFFQSIFILLGLLSIVIGTFGGLFQKRLKRLIAYSTISHMGFVLFGLSTMTVDGIQAALIYLVLYLLMNIVIFGVLMICVNYFWEYTSPETGKILHRTPIMFEYITDLTFLNSINKGAVFVLIISLLSMAGIPPFAGFFSKVFIFIAAFNSVLYAISIIAIILSVISCFYYLRLIRLIYFSPISIKISMVNVFKHQLNELTKVGDEIKYNVLNESNNEVIKVLVKKEIPVATSYTIAIAAILLIFFIFYPDFLLTITYIVATSL